MDPFLVESLSGIGINSSPQANLFSEVCFCVSGTINTKLLKLLERGGGKQRTYAGVGVTHFIAAPDADEIKVEEVKDIFEIPIVSPRWITYSVLLQRVFPIHGFNGEVNQLFSMVTATVSGARGSDLKNIWASITYYGGTFTKVLTGQCTHLIINTCTGNKYKMAQQKGIVVVCFDWLTESISKGKIEDPRYYHPSLLIQQPVRVTQPEVPPPILPREQHVQQRPPFQVGIRPPTTSAQHWTQQQQAEIIRQIQSDPQIKQQWGQMDHQQRTLLIQKLAQRNREDHLRREMMIRQQQMNLQNTAGQQRQQQQQQQQQQQHQVNINLTPVGPQGPPPTVPQMPHTSTQQQMEEISPQSGKPNSSPTIVTNQKNSPIVCPPQQQLIKSGNQEQPLLNSQVINFDNRQQQHNQYSQHVISSQSQQQLLHSLNNTSQQVGYLQPRPIARQIITSQSKQFIPQVFTQGQGSQMNRGHDIETQDQTIFKSQNSEVVQQQPQQRITPQQQQNFEGLVKAEQQIFTPQLTQQSQERMPNKHPGSPQVSHQQNIFQSHPSNDIIETCAGSTQQQHQRILPQQHQSPIPQLQEHKFFPTQRQEFQLHKPNQLGQITVAQQQQQQQQGVTDNMIRTQQIISPQRINIRHVFVHQGEQPRLQQQQIILQQQQQPPSEDINLSGHQIQKVAVLQTQAQVQPTVSSPQWISSPIRQSREPNNIQTTAQIQQHARPIVSDASAITQQWSSPVRHQSQPHGSIIYTTSQHNLPFVQVVNSKTKTALANLLSNRLQGNNGPETTTTMMPASSPQQGQCPSTPPISQIHHTVSPPIAPVPCQQNLNERRTLSNLTNNEKPPQPPSTLQVVPQSVSLATARAQFYGHDPNIKLPSDGFLLGCIFWAAQPMDCDGWEKCVQQYGGEVERMYCPRLTHVICTTQKFPEFHQSIREGKRLVTLHWLSDICVRKCVVSPFYALHLPVPITRNERPLEGELLSISGFTSEDRTRVKVMCSILGATVTPYFTMMNMALVTHKPEGLKYQKAREWKKPVVNVQFLNELMFGQNVSTQMIHSPKYQHFNLEQPFRCDIGLVNQLMAAWKVPIRVGNDSFEKYRYRKRSSLENKDETEHAKRMRLFNTDKELLNTLLTSGEGNKSGLNKESCPTPNTAPVIILSGFSRVYKDKMTENIEMLGGKITEDVYCASHLITKPSCRTKKLFVCISRVSYIVSTTWIYDSLAQGRFVDVSNYTLDDPQFESSFGRKIGDILTSPDRKLLFVGLTFYLTPSIEPCRSITREVIEAAGGQVDTSQHSLKSIRALAIATKKYIIITCSNDFHLLRGLMEEKETGKITLYYPDDVFTSIVKQKSAFE